MATQQTRPFAKDYSGLVQQTVLAGAIILICVSWHEVKKRKRRGKGPYETLGSVESWQFGYLYQGRSWAKRPSPPIAQGWPFSWVKQAITFPESKISELRGVDASLYCRFIRGCWWFTALHSFTTTVILLPIHLHFSDSAQYSHDSMNRALISALVTTSEGPKLLWVHLVLMLWVTVTWMLTLVWISRGAFRYRKQAIEEAAAKAKREAKGIDALVPYPHPQHPFHAMPPLEEEKDTLNKGLRLRTVMVTNLPSRLRDEKELKEYYEYYLNKPLMKPSIGLTSSTQPGLINKLVSYVIIRARRHGLFSRTIDEEAEAMVEEKKKVVSGSRVEHVIIVRKMSELSSLLDRREEMLKRLETAHIRLAVKALEAVRDAMDLKEHGPSRGQRAKKRMYRMSGLKGMQSLRSTARTSGETDLEAAATDDDSSVVEDRTELLIRTLGPFVEKFGMRNQQSLVESARTWVNRGVEVVVHRPSDEAHLVKTNPEKKPATPEDNGEPGTTIWEALFSLPRSSLDAFQPLVHLNALFRGRTVPAIDYYTAKVNLLTALIIELRGRPPSDWAPVSTAFVTFKHPDDARKASRYLAVHPKNPLTCLTTMAPEYEDLDWVRVMKQTYKTEILKDWVVDIGVWAFTIAWIIPVSLLVALVSIQNIATLLPWLQSFLDRHQFLQEVIASLLPTLLTSLLILLIPLLLLLIAKKAHTINTLSALHDRILTRYHKFLVANILVFFCVGVTTLESFFTSFKTNFDVLSVIGQSFPSAGPFYIGWFIFTTAIHGGIELVMFGLPLFVYPFTKRQVTPRKRAVGIRPRTFNYYYWLPNHILIVILLLVFAILNPLLTPFILIYFSVEFVVIRNQLIHVYAKSYEGNGAHILIRLMRYSLDGLILAQIIFMGFLGVNKKEVHVALTAVMIAATIVVKLVFTRICKSKFESADIIESHVVCGVEALKPTGASPSVESIDGMSAASSPVRPGFAASKSEPKFKTWKLPKGFKFNYNANAQDSSAPNDHKPIPFEDATRFKRLKSWDDPQTRPHGATISSRHSESMPDLVTGRPVQSSPEREETLKKLISPTTRPPLVTEHEKHPPWDDSSRLDRPFDNPYYVRPIDNHLWLPRNPVGLLNLDDTVNVFRSLTSDASLGQLGEWVEEGIALADLPDAESVDNASLADTDSISPPPVRRGMTGSLSGSEDIQLPPEIAQRVENLENERDVDHAEEFGARRPPAFRRPSLVPSFRRPSLISRRSTNSDFKRDSPPRTPRPRASESHLPEGQAFTRPRTAESRQPRPTTAGSRTSTMYRASSLSPPRASSFMSSTTGPNSHVFPRRRESSAFADLAINNGIYPQPLPHAAHSHVSFATAATGRTKARSGSASSVPITTREAVVGEVIAEEQHATEIREREEATGEKAPSTRSWLTSWMYSKIPWSSHE